MPVIGSSRHGGKVGRRPVAPPPDPINLIVEVAGIPQALAHPTFGPSVFTAIMEAIDTNAGRRKSGHGEACFCCDRSWREIEPPVSAALGTIDQHGVVGLICEECSGDGLEERVKRTLGDLFGCHDARRLDVAPGGRA